MLTLPLFSHVASPCPHQNKQRCPGMRACAVLAVCMLCVSCTGKSSSQRLHEVEFTAQENQNNIAEVSHRVAALENRMDSLSGEVKQMDARTYEVRNKAGRKTGMTAHPVIPPAPPAVTAPAATPAMQTPGAAPVPTAPIPAAQATATPAQAAAANAAMAPVSDETSTQQRPKAPLPSMDTVPPPMPMPGQAQATRGNASPALSLPPVQAAQASPVMEGAQASAPVVTAPVQSMPAVTPPAAPTTASRRPVVQPAPAPQAAMAPAVTAPPAPADSLALPPEGGMAPAQATAPGMTQASAMTQASGVTTAKGGKAASGVEPARLPSAAKGEEGAYKAALSLVMSGKAAQGREKFNEFLQTYPSGRFAANAHYWIGESYYAQGNYPEALMAFKQVSTQFPRHHKTADALLKAGMTYQKLGDKENAQLQFKALQTDFPNSEAAGRIRRSGR